MRLTIDTPLSSSRAMLIGLALVAPGAWFLAANVLNDAGITFLYAPFDAVLATAGPGRAFNLISPVIFLGGPALALLLNFLATGRLDVKWERGQLVGTVAIAPRPANLAMLVCGGLILAGFLGYAFAENYRIVPTHV